MATNTLVSGIRVTDESSAKWDFPLMPTDKGGVGLVIEPRAWEPGDPLRRWRIPLHPFIGGMNIDRLNGSPSTYAKANADATYHGLLLFPPKVYSLTGANLSSPVKLVTFDSKVFAIGGRYVYYFDPATNTLTEDEDLGVGVSAVDAAVFNNELIIACGESTKIFKRTTAGTYTQATDNTYAIALGVVGSYLWRAESTNKLSNCASTPLTLANWTPASPNQYAVGDTTYAVNTIIDYGGIPWAFKGDGVYAPDPQSRFKNQAPQLARTPHTDNCFPAETLVRLNKTTKRIFRRHFSGELVEVTTALGHKLAGTPNHPVLTDRGWVGLGSLKEGDRIVSSRFTQGVSGGNPDVDDVNASIGEVFSALLKVGHHERHPGVPMDFHGDGQNGDIDVVDVDWELVQRFKATFGQPINHLGFAEAGLVSDKVAANTPALELGSTRFASSILHRGNERDAVGLGHSSESHTGGAGLTAGGHSCTSQPTIDGVFLDAVDLGGFCCSEAGEVGLDHIVGIVRKPFAGHVYNLETLSSRYIANGIVVHNCKGAFVAQGSLWVPSSSGLFQIRTGRSRKRGPELTFRPDYRFWVRGGVEYGDFIYIVATDEASSGSTFIGKINPDIHSETTGHEYIYQEWARLDGASKSYCLAVTTAGTNPELVTAYGTTGIRYLKLGRGGGRDIDDANCVPGDSVVGASPRVMLVTRRPWVGEAVRIETRLGNKMTATPNHPVLTNRGWVRADAVVEGDSVFRSDGRLEARPGNPDVVDTDPTIAEIFDFLAVSGTHKRIRGVTEQFHGDGQDGEVDVVFVDSHLLDRLQTAISEPSSEKILSSALLGEGEFAPLRSAAHFFLRNGSLSRGPSGLLKKGATSKASVRGLAGKSSVLSGRETATLDSSTAQDGRNSIVRDMVVAGERILGLPGDVAPDDVIRVSRIPFSGHVYNLHTEHGHFSSNGLIVHNCHYGTDMSLETGAAMPSSDLSQLSTLVGVDTLLDYSRTNESLTVAYRWDSKTGAESYTNLLDEAESGGGTAAITGTGWSKASRYAAANNTGRFLEVKFTGAAAMGGTANAAVTTTDTTLTDTRLSLTTNCLIGATITCNGKTMTITSNTATALTGSAWSGGSNPGNSQAWSLDIGGAGTIRPAIREAWAHGYSHPEHTDVISLGLWAIDGAEVNGRGTGISRDECIRKWRDWQNRGVELLLELEGYERSRNTRVLVKKVEVLNVLATPGKHPGTTQMGEQVKVQLIRVDRSGQYADA